MAVKGSTSPSSISSPVKKWVFLFSHFREWRFGVLTILVFLGMIFVLTIDGSSVQSFMEIWGVNNRVYETETLMGSRDLRLIQHSAPIDPINPNGTELSRENLTHSVPTHIAIPSVIAKFVPNGTDLVDSDYTQKVKTQAFLKSGPSPWVSAELEPNFTTNLLSQWMSPGGEGCRDSKTSDVSIPGLDIPGNVVKLSAGDVHEFVFMSLDDSGKPRCSGGDYFETDLSGEKWKSRPLVKDFGNGSYSVSLQVHQDFHGMYNFTMILLYRRFEGLRFSPWRFAYDKGMRNVSIEFSPSKSRLPEIRTCERSDFSQDIWSGRWTRHAWNDRCSISNDGRYRCLAPNLACTGPWCDGPLGSLESNGWVYSTHCSFRLFTSRDAWNCLAGRWIFFWGDSNHVDTIRNMLNFILDLPDIASVPRRFDKNFTNPKNQSQTVRITSIFNGHWNETMNYQGFNSLQDKGFRGLLLGYFSEKTVPDTIILNSGLHDGVFWKNIRRYSDGAQYAASFWAGVLNSIRERGLETPRVYYRTTVATGGYARAMAFNPMKMEIFNWVALEKFREAGVVSGVIDNFDMTFPWHFDNRCSDGVHYGRAPAKMKWRDGEIGHQYFVDLMLAHVLLNALCVG